MAGRRRLLPAIAIGALLLGPGAFAPCCGAEPRRAQVAGSFYPADPAALRQQVQEFLNATPPAGDFSGKPRLLIVPHAGYPYSGPVAGRAFRQVKGLRYDGVVVVGFTHQMVFDGVSVDTRPAYETPLGEIPVDARAVQFLLDQPAAVHHEEGAHSSGEHSLEVMLPFLQEALGRFKLVPVLMSGGASAREAEALAGALAALAARGDYLFVFSTDLSHYHPDEEARRIDERTVSAILYETPQAVSRLFGLGALEACGRGPVMTALFTSERIGYPSRALLSYANSGDTAGTKERVVGYAAVGFFDREKTAAELLPEAVGAALPVAARHALERYLTGGEAPRPIEGRKEPALQRVSGAFVTLRKQGQLRGCIGRIVGEQPLAASIPQIAVEAATQDRRFPPVTAEELREIHIDVSVLTPMAPIASADEIVPGRDGVVLDAGIRHGVFLPSVWAETGWTRLEFLRELSSQKAGLEPDAWRDASLSVFQAQLFEE